MAFDNKRTSMKMKRLHSPEGTDDESIKKRAKKAQSKKMNNLHKVAETTKDKDLQDFITELSQSLKQFEKLDPSLKMIVRSVLNDNEDRSEQFKSVPIEASYIKNPSEGQQSYTAEPTKPKL